MKCSGGLLGCFTALALTACGGGKAKDGPQRGGQGIEADASLSGSRGDAGQKPGGNSRDGGSSADPDGGESCAAVSARAELTPVHLAFAFDVSGSMGQHDYPWHDKSKKWDPVVDATRTFFESAGSVGITASLTFFPAEDDKCEQPTYKTPDVGMTALPSTAFGAAIDAIEPKQESDWRGGTPTAAVMRGTRSFLEDYRKGHEGLFSIVLVTDGYPQGCSAEDNKVATVVAEADAALAAGISTYVIGVRNPPIEGAPETVNDLNAVAVAGDTKQAYLIDTGDPEATAAALEAAINEIRGASISCELKIPDPPDGRTFDRTRVRVSYKSGGNQTRFSFDRDCAADDSWRYDDSDAPKLITLCPSTCEKVKSDPSAAIDVAFLCESDPTIVL